MRMLTEQPCCPNRLERNEYIAGIHQSGPAVFDYEDHVFLSQRPCEDNLRPDSGPSTIRILSPRVPSPARLPPHYDTTPQRIAI
jgi:hypothetical protein